MVLCVFFGFICFVCFLECLYFCFMLFCAFWLSVRFFVCLYFGFIVSVGVLVFFVFTVLFLRFILFCMFRSSVCVFCLILFCVSIESKSRVGTTKWLTTHANRRGAAAAVVTFPLFFIFPWPFFSFFFYHFHNLSSFHLNSRAAGEPQNGWTHSWAVPSTKLLFSIQWIPFTIIVDQLWSSTFKIITFQPQNGWPHTCATIAIPL